MVLRSRGRGRVGRRQLLFKMSNAQRHCRALDILLSPRNPESRILVIFPNRDEWTTRRRGGLVAPSLTPGGPLIPLREDNQDSGFRIAGGKQNVQCPTVSLGIWTF